MLNSKRILARGDIAEVAVIALARWVTLALRWGACSAWRQLKQKEIWLGKY